MAILNAKNISKYKSASFSYSMIVIFVAAPVSHKGNFIRLENMALDNAGIYRVHDYITFEFYHVAQTGSIHMKIEILEFFIEFVAN